MTFDTPTVVTEDGRWKFETKYYKTKSDQIY